MKQTLIKGLTIALAVMTATWSIGIAAFAPVSAAATSGAASSGDLVKASLAAVYYVGNDGKRYVFPNEKTYKSWWSNFDSVMTISDSELASMAIGGNATYRPSSRLVKITTDPKVYMVGANGALHSIADESTAADLFGSAWNTLIDDVSDAFFTNYTVASGEVNTASLGAGELPTGTVMMADGGSDYYGVRASDNAMLSGVTNVISAFVRSSMANLELWSGSTLSGLTTVGLNTIATPDRDGTLEGGTGTPDTNDGNLTIEVTKKAENLSMAATGGSQNIGVTDLRVCAGSATTLRQLDVFTGSGTVGPDSMLSWFDFSGLLYEVSGTLNNVTVEYTSTDSALSLAAGECVNGTYNHATNSQSGLVVLSLTGAEYDTGAAAAGLWSGSLELARRSAVAIAASDLANITFSNPVPSGVTLQTDGTMQQVFGVQANVANHDMYIPYVTFKLSGAIDVSSCEFRLNGPAISTNYEVYSGKYYTFDVPETSRVFAEGTKNWEMWCNVNGEAGQTVTPQLIFPSPMMLFADNERTAAAAITGKELIAPSITRISLSVPAPLALAGASATIEVINNNNVTNSVGVNLTDESTNGSTNMDVAFFKAKIRGSKATISSLNLIMTGTHAAKGMTRCQIRIGQRSDRGEFSTTSVNMADFSMSNYGGQNTVLGANVPVTANKQMEVGDWLIAVRCDVVTGGAAYADGDVMAVNLNTGTSNVIFDVGTTIGFPTGPAAGTTVTIRLLTSITVASNATTLNLVQSGVNQVLGSYTITAPTQEGVNITTISVAFLAGVSGASGCTTVTLKNLANEELATSQSLTGAVTLTFSVTASIDSNAQYVVRVVCTQASSAVVAAPLPGVANATSLTAVNGTGQTSSQSFTANATTAPATFPVLGASVVVVISGTISSSTATNQPTRIIGPNKELKLIELTFTASIHEGMDLRTFTVDLGLGGAAVVNDLASLRITAENLTNAAGVSSAAAVDICTRVVTGIAVTCSFSSKQWRLVAGETASIAVYGTGNSFGNIAVAGGLIADNVAPSVNTTTGALFTGAHSQLAVNAGGGAQAGRVVTPFAADWYLVKNALPSTLQGGQLNMVLWVADLVVAGSTLTLDQLGFTCSTNGAATCAGADSNSLEIDSSIVSTVTTTVGAGAGFTPATPLTIGTHAARILSNQATCTTGETVQLNLNSVDFSANDGTGVDSLLTGETVTEPWNSAPANSVSGHSNLCG